MTKRIAGNPPLSRARVARAAFFAPFVLALTLMGVTQGHAQQGGALGQILQQQLQNPQGLGSNALGTSGTGFVEQGLAPEMTTQNYTTATRMPPLPTSCRRQASAVWL
jgi:hypothetical protein